ncbi:MAG: hypothetical protein M0013_03965 [Actinomycetota bacterium]|nr:hypothetical protein [Actinomycetota bacterium]
MTGAWAAARDSGLAALARLVAVVAVGTALPAPAAASSLPRLSATPSAVRPGSVMSIGAYGLNPLTDYQVQICGDAGIRTSADCDLPASTTAATSQAGHFVVELRVAAPPAPCPCVVKAEPLVGRGTLTQQVLTVPITITGASYAPPAAQAVSEGYSGLRVIHAVVVGSGSWAEWFGATPHRALLVRLRNVSADLIPSTPFVLRAGQGPDPSQVVATPVLPPLFPGQTVSYRVPVTFPAMSIGHYEVVGSLGSVGQIVPFTARTTLMPWGLLALAALVVALTVARAVMRRRRRAARSATGRPVAGRGPVSSGPAIPQGAADASQPQIPTGRPA